MRSARIDVAIALLALSAALSAELSAVLAPAFAARNERTLTVFAAASLTESFNEIGKTWKRRHPGFDLRINFAGSQQLALQIEQGAKPDVSAPADERWMTYIKERSLVAGEAEVFARNRLVVIVPATNPARIGKLEDLARRGVKMLIAAEAVPVGKYTRDALQNLSRRPGFPADFARRVLANVVSEEENVRAILAKVHLGEADAGIVYRSDITSAVSRSVRAIEIPEESNILASYYIAVLSESKYPEEARSFVDLVLSTEGQRVLVRYGLIAARPDAP